MLISSDASTNKERHALNLLNAFSEMSELFAAMLLSCALLRLPPIYCLWASTRHRRHKQTWLSNIFTVGQIPLRDAILTPAGRRARPPPTLFNIS